jgi:AcrR family transcriptional regulator
VKVKIPVGSLLAVEPRPRLSRERIVQAALALADREGIEAVSMRRLAQELGSEPMSLYTHVRNKEDMLDAMVDAVIDELPRDEPGGDWKASLRQTVLGARRVILGHPWMPRVVETRMTPGPAVPRYFNWIIGVLREGGFSLEQTHHALHILGSRVLGFTQDAYDDSGDLSREEAAAFAGQIRDTMPYVAEMALSATHDGPLGGCDSNLEFAFALDFILDGLERILPTE